jgi:hypothetical protein
LANSVKTSPRLNILKYAKVHKNCRLQVLEEFYNIFGPELKAVTGDPKRIDDVIHRVDLLVEPLERVGHSGWHFLL